ncbi:MAG: FecR domain-containing protein [Saonia sp.]
MFEEKDETILARWMAGKLTPEELAEFEQSPEFREYEQIAQGMERFKKPSFDKEALRTKVLDSVNAPQKGNLRVLRPLLYISGIAASILLVIGLFFNEVTYSTQTGEQLSITLPDGSTVQLNARSQLTHQRFFWENNKTVHLQGEGYFSIEKGDGFAVGTASGTVSVLGTQFNIKTRKASFELACYEGNVQFDATNTKEVFVLTQGDGVKLIEGAIKEGNIDARGPTWISGKSTFENTPLSDVLYELEIQYGINFQNEPNLNVDHFTGSFVHDNLQIALKTVLVPMGIEYKLSNDQKTVILKSP